MERFTSFDFGLSGLAALFHEDWILTGGVEEVVDSYLSVGEAPVADEAQQKETAALERDVAELAGSSLSEGRIEMLFSMSTAWNYPFQGDETGRVLLGRIGRACRRWKAIYGWVPLEADAAWSSQAIVNEVCDVIAKTPLQLPEEFRRYFRSEVSELRDALDACVRSASAELAFRLLLRIHVANFIPVDRSAWARYRGIACRLALGEDLLSSLEFLSPETDPRSN
ncbi:hypothetical protein ABZ341_35350 [Streptomyces sp. NPDC006173]|uniref:hypothetical protein n=1 Tax=Streptomyces sp. NPDC006173 TaxID=3155349 RepID=UPI003407D824